MIKSIAAFIVLTCSIIPKTTNCQNTGDIINNNNLQLKEAKTTIAKILSSASLMYLHSLTPFRKIIKAYAKAEKIKIVTDIPAQYKSQCILIR